MLCLISIYWPDKSTGHYGATVAAPYVRQVLERTLAYLNVPPDLPAERPRIADGGPLRLPLLAQATVAE